MPNAGEVGRPVACIHVDLDGLWAMGMSFGMQFAADPDPILQSGVGHFLELFARHRVTATFFLTGRDARLRSNAPLIAEILGAGHEIANHSMSHRPNFTGLARREIEADIDESTKAVEEATGVKCLGFRTPTYNVDGFILRLLQERGYLYDSSLLPTFVGPALGLANRLSRGGSLVYGRAVHAAAPLSPYHPDEQAPWRRGSMGIVEVPISTMPLLRLPFHCSYVLQGGTWLFRLGFLLTRLLHRPLVYLFHAREMAEAEGDWTARLPFRDLPLAKRKAVLEAILGRITAHCAILTTRELAGRATSAA